jgi:NDP-sugar pyrophosphorylase family protein
MASKWRPLTPAEISKLTSQGCTCPDWSKVQVADGFNPERVKTTGFSGDVRLGLFQKDVRFEGGLIRPTGISYATIHNCYIGNNVYINQVKSYIANYTIEDDVVIENVDLLALDGQTSFGNGTDVVVINEAGGREIPIYDNLSAQLGYVIALYRHRPKLIEKLRALISQYAASVASSMGLVGAGAKIFNSRIIKNVRIGPAATIEAASRLENGSINSCPQDPVYIGPGVFAHNFIACSGSKISDGAIVSNCFVGQATELAKQYSAENSVFFANCGGFHGEACSIFAGPYTVTHHKSTLLIAGLFSFLNAGSGTNQSNHMYKLGPVHQGIVERGSKTASDSYMLWPAKVGAFTVVMGRHYRNSDTSDLPFSYLIEHEDESVLAPGVNLRSVGTLRDARKWPKRDKRKDPKKLDLINFKLLSPYTIQKMLNGCDILRTLKTTSGEASDYFTYHSVKIKSDALDRGIRFYQIGIDKFLGNCLIHRLNGKQFTNIQQLRTALKPETDTGTGKWIDIAGMLAPENVVDKILDDIESGALGTLDQVTAAFTTAHDNYPAYEWAWAANVLQQRLGKTIDAITSADVIDMTNKWKSAVVELDNTLQADTKKEFTATAQIGFGIDGDLADRAADFAGVRGTFETNSVVKEIKQHIEIKTQLAEELIRRMQKIC